MGIFVAKLLCREGVAYLGVTEAGEVQAKAEEQVAI